MLKQKLSTKLLQKLSPQQIQLMKLLQVPTASLEERIKEELEENPALEELDEKNIEDEIDYMQTEQPEDEAPALKEDELDLAQYLDDDDEIASYKLRGERYTDPDEAKTIPIAVIETFHERLIEQVGMMKIPERQIKIAKQIIGSLDDDGYLRRELRAISNDLAFTQNISATEEELEQVLHIVQSFDPAGVGCRNLQECLLLQISRKSGPDQKYIEIAEEILDNHFEEFSKKHYEKLIKSMSISREDLRMANEEILKLNPKPGGSFNISTTVENYIVPDFIIENENGKLALRLHQRNAPDLRISDNYKSMLKDFDKSNRKDKRQRDTIMFIKQKIDSAKWFIDAIKQRQQTMLKVMKAIQKYQYEYFLTGDEVKLRPMILKDIAEVTKLDISTVSRVSNSKYVQTEFGTFQLKSFFSESLQTDTGEEVSTREVKKILSNLINNEDKRKPLSDQKLTDCLIDRGYNIARRTVAKYREQLSIPVARLRREL